MAFRMAVCLALEAETISFLTAEAAGRLAGATGFFAGESTDFLAAGAVVDPAGSFTEGAAGSGIAGETGATATGATGPCAPPPAGFDWPGRSRRRTAASTDLTSCITSPARGATHQSRQIRGDGNKGHRIALSAWAKRNAADYGRNAESAATRWRRSSAASCAPPNSSSFAPRRPSWPPPTSCAASGPRRRVSPERAGGTNGANGTNRMIPTARKWQYRFVLRRP